MRVLATRVDKAQSKGDSTGMEKLPTKDAVIAAAREVILVAMTREGVIGAGNRIPWHLPEELRLFRQLTLGGTVIMGRKTFASLGRPLAQRRNIVISTTLAETPGIILCRDFPSAVATAEAGEGKIFYIGGRAIYQLALARAELLRISWIPGNPAGDCYFPDFDRSPWRLAAVEDFGTFVHECYLRERG